MQTFVPVIEGSSTVGVGTYTLQTASYQQVGNVIHFHLSVVTTAHTGTGNIKISGFPRFPVGQNAVTYSGFDVGGLVAGDIPLGSVDASRKLTVFKNNAGATNFVVIQGVMSINVSGSYFVQ